MFCIAALTACAGARDSDRAMERDVADEVIDPDGVVAHQLDDEAVTTLWEEAELAYELAAWEEAAALLEEALAKGGDDPVLLSRLAEVQLYLGENLVAENTAAHANALADDMPLLRYRNWLMIIEARRQRGDSEGVAEAEAEAARLRDGGP